MMVLHFVVLSRFYFTFYIKRLYLSNRVDTPDETQEDEHPGSKQSNNQMRLNISQIINSSRCTLYPVSTKTNPKPK